MISDNRIELLCMNLLGHESSANIERGHERGIKRTRKKKMTYDQAVGWPKNVSAAFCVQGFFSSSLEDTPKPSGVRMPRTFLRHSTNRSDNNLP